MAYRKKFSKKKKYKKKSYGKKRKIRPMRVGIRF